jgi:serine/threonine protein kinase
MDPNILKKMTDNKMGINQGKLVGYDQKADIWSLGTLCYEMLIGKAAFNCRSMEELVQKVESGSYQIPTNLSKEVISFLNGMLQYNAQKRLSADELARHHFLTKDVKHFQPIDLRKVSNKVRNNNLNINIKKNQTIWSIFNEEDEKKLINIPGNFLSPMDTPIKEEDEQPYLENKRRNTEKIPTIPKFGNNNNFKNFQKNNENDRDFIMKANTQKFPGYGTGPNGINAYNNMNNRPGFGFPNFQSPMPQMGPHFPQNMPMNYIPPSLGGVGPQMPNPMMFGMGQSPIMQLPTFGVPSPGEDPNAQSAYVFSSGIFQHNLPFHSDFGSYAGGYGYGYGF